MKAIITILECAAASTVIVFILQDGFWDTTLGAVILVIALANIFFGFWLYGFTKGEKAGQSNHDVLFREGFQTGKRWRG